jgi:hypothetical protein
MFAISFSNNANIQPVKKLFFIFLLIMLPLQSSWAAAASYCQHEQTSTTHFGHHSHQHELQDISGDASKSASAHSDCGYCHLFCQASFSTAPFNMMLPSGPVQLAATPFHFSSHIPEGPKRPDWRVVA